jgi:F420-non-reducing hydrogenase large subunit
VIAKVGVETVRKIIAMRVKLRDLIALAGGKVSHPVFGLPGGVARAISAEEQARFRAAAAEAVDFARFTLDTFDALVLKNSAFLDLIRSDPFTHRTYYMGLTDQDNRINFYDGSLRVVTPEGREFAKFPPARYLDQIAEHVEPWSYMKFCYLKPVGWKGFVEGHESGVYGVAPQARLNAAEGMATPLAQAEYDKYFATLGGKPVHHTLANHCARLVELLYAAERMQELAADPDIADPHIRNLPERPPHEGVGVVEAPRGTLIHHYQTDENGIIRKVNLIVATQNNAARMAMSVERAAQSLISGGNVPEPLLNQVEMAFRAYDPCLGCATHSQSGSMPLLIRTRDSHGGIVSTLCRDSEGRIRRSGEES